MAAMMAHQLFAKAMLHQRRRGRLAVVDVPPEGERRAVHRDRIRGSFQHRGLFQLGPDRREPGAGACLGALLHARHYRKGAGEKIPDWSLLEASVYGTDVSRQMLRISMMNLVLHGIRHAKLKRANSLSDMAAGKSSHESCSSTV